MNANTAARKIQKGWRRTAMRLGRLGETANENRVNYSILKNIPLPRLHQILLRIAQKNHMNWKYSINNRGHMIYHGGPENVRLNRNAVIYDIAMLTNLRPRRNRVGAARVIQAHARGAKARREASFRRTPFAKSLPRNVLNRILSR